jgi:hypothetical protein
LIAKNGFDQAGSGGRRHAVDLVEPQLCVGECLMHQALDVVEVAARGDLRHDATIGAMLVVLRQDAIGENPALVVDHRGRRLIAARFDPKDDHDSLP